MPCTAAIPNPGPQILLQHIRGREGGRGGLLSARCSVVIPTSSSFLDSRSDRRAVCKNDLLHPPPPLYCSLGGGGTTQKPAPKNRKLCEQTSAGSEESDCMSARRMLSKRAATIADGRVGGSKFLNMHNTRSTLQNSAGGTGESCIHDAQDVAVCRRKPFPGQEPTETRGRNFCGPLFLRMRRVEKNVLRSRHLRC